MSGRPEKYTRGRAIAHLMQDHRRPIIQKLATEKHGLGGFTHLQTIYIGPGDYGDDLFICLTSTAEWLPRIFKLDSEGRWHPGSSKVQGWPTEEEIAACIAESEEREKNWNGSLSTNDFTAIKEMTG